MRIIWAFQVAEYKGGEWVGDNAAFVALVKAYDEPSSLPLVVRVQAIAERIGPDAVVEGMPAEPPPSVLGPDGLQPVY